MKKIGKAVLEFLKGIGGLILLALVAVGDVVEFRGFGDTDGTSVGLDAGTTLLVERVA